MRALSHASSAAGACAAIIVACVLVAGCERSRSVPGVTGDAERGGLLLRQYGCGACHRITGVPTAAGKVGPPLDGLRERVYIAGVIPNTSENLVRWIRAPQDIDPLTAMPNLQVTDAHARDMVAYLYGID